MRRPPLSLALGATVIVCVCTTAIAHARTGAEVDRLDPSARGAALGEAGVTTPEGPFAVHWNVAGLALEDRASVGATYSPIASGIREDAWALHTGLAVRLGALGLGAQFAHLDAGGPLSTSRVESETQDAVRLGGALNVIDLFGVAPQDDILDFSVGVLAERIGVDRSSPGRVTQDLGTGGPDGAASAWTMGAGALARWGRHLPSAADAAGPAWFGVRAGFAYDCIIESDLEYDASNLVETLPSRMRLGIAGEAHLLPSASGRTRLDALFGYERQDDVSPGSEAAVHRVGGEVEAFDRYAIRAGYVSDEEGQIEDGTFGAGVQVLPGDRRPELWIDYASRPQASGLDRVHLFTVRLSYPVAD